MISNKYNNIIMELMCQTIHKINHLNLELKIEGLDDTTITIEGKYSINFTRSRGKFCFKSVS